MTENILAPSTEVESDQYSLPEIDRQAILAQSDSAILRRRIERQRAVFIQRHGNEWGVNNTEPG